MPQPLESDTVRRIPLVIRRRARTFRLSVHQAHRRGGWSAALREAVAVTAQAAARPVHLWRERRLDNKRQLDTGEDQGVLSSSVDPPSKGAFDDSVAYEPTPLHLLQNLLRRLPISRPADFAFIDLGCGKGRTLFVAAEHGFAPVIGVELDPRLAEIARDNVRTYAAAAPSTDCPIAVVEKDAALYEFPSVPVVLFLFNPFGVATLGAVADNLAQSIAETPRPVVVAYFNPVHHQVLEASPALRLITITRSWAIFRSVD